MLFTVIEVHGKVLQITKRALMKSYFLKILSVLQNVQNTYLGPPCYILFTRKYTPSIFEKLIKTYQEVCFLARGDGRQTQKTQSEIQYAPWKLSNPKNTLGVTQSTQWHWDTHNPKRFFVDTNLEFQKMCYAIYLVKAGGIMLTIWKTLISIDSILRCTSTTS